MNAAGWAIAGFLAGWILGVWMSHRKIQATRRRSAGALVDLVKQIRQLEITLEDNEVIDLNTEEGRRRILESIAGKTKH